MGSLESIFSFILSYNKLITKKLNFGHRRRQQTARKFEFCNSKSYIFLINSRIPKFFFIIIFGCARSPGGVRLSIRPVWSLTLPVVFEIPPSKKECKFLIIDIIIIESRPSRRKFFQGIVFMISNIILI